MLIALFLVYVWPGGGIGLSVFFFLSHFIYISGSFFWLDPNINYGFLSVLSVLVILLLVVGCMVSMNMEEEALGFYYIPINPTGVMMGALFMIPVALFIDNFLDCDPSYAFFITAMTPSLLMYLGMLIKRRYIKRSK